MQIIILSGTIGSGKSSVAAFLRELGAAVIDSDEIARHVIDPGTPAYRKVVQEFGQAILDDQQKIDRQKLAACVFENPRALKKLNGIIHPGVDDVVETLFEEYQAAGKSVVFVEMAFLANARWKSRVTGYWIVKTSREKALQRLEQRGISRTKALARLANQSDPATQITGEFTLVTNDGSLEELKKEVAKIWQKMDNKERH